MFNPFYARPIGSERFERHLLTLMLESDEKRKAADEAVPVLPVNLRVDPCVRAHGWNPDRDGWYALKAAIEASAVADYLDCYIRRLQREARGDDAGAYVWQCRCITLENEYFRKDEELSALLDSILAYVVHNWEDRTLSERILRMDHAARRLLKVMHPAGDKEKRKG